MVGKKKNEAPDKVVLTSKQVDELQERIENNSLSTKDMDMLKKLLAFNFWLQDRLSRAKLTIKRLQALFGFSSESGKNKKSGKDEQSPACDNMESNKDASSGSTEVAKAAETDVNWDPSQNHGRYGAADYEGCKDIEVSFTNETLINGHCPSCAENDTVSTIYQADPSVIVLLDAQPLICGSRFHLQKARCSVCQEYFTAQLPDAVADQPKYSHRCSSAIAIHHYYSGMPFKRLEMLQAAQKVPLSDSTQYDLMNKLFSSAIEPVAGALRTCAANGSGFYFDDTAGKILEQMANNQQANTRKQKKSIHTTALISKYQGHRIYLFDTNTQTAGKQFKALLAQRNTEDDFITMTDASASNFPMLDDRLMARWVISLCLSHGRRRFIELLGDDNKDVAFIVDIIAQVYENDHQCKILKLTSEERLHFHQQRSKPIMLAMRTWLNNLLLFKKVEPNSQFGESIMYMLKRWEWLTQFLQTPGAPLDNNICEQAVKVAIRYRNTSFFYRTFYGASIGDAIMGLLHTARHAGVNIFDYLNSLQENKSLVSKNPERWLPWCYQETLSSLELCTSEDTS